MMTLQGKKSAARRQSKVHFQTPEANVVSEAADPLQDDRNNSSQAGSTPFQKARPPRRVSFADSNVVSGVTDSGHAGDCEQAEAAPVAQGSKKPVDMYAQDMSAIAAASTDSASAPPQCSLQNSAASRAVTLPNGLVAAPGSTPYMKGSRSSAALQAANTAEQQTADPDADEALLQTDLRFRMSQLLQPDEEQHALPHQQVRCWPHQPVQQVFGIANAPNYSMQLSCQSITQGLLQDKQVLDDSHQQSICSGRCDATADILPSCLMY